MSTVHTAPGRAVRIAAALLAPLSVAAAFAPARAQTAPADAAGAEDARSVAHAWVDAALFAIRNDFARPTVHARNLYHLSAAMYDAWAAYDPDAAPLWLGPDAFDPECLLGRGARDAVREAAGANDPETARRTAVGHAAWRFLVERYRTSPNLETVMEEFARVAAEQGLGEADGEGSAALGARAAACALATGRADASNEAGNYANLDYAPVNPPLDPTRPGNPDVVDPDRWQPLSFESFVDQSGNEADASEFLGAEWGRLEPFALPPEARTEVARDGVAHPVWLDPGPPPRLGAGGREAEAYARHFALVALWSGHLDPTDGRMLDISPGASGNAYPFADRIKDPLLQLDAYDALEGGAPTTGHPVNPVTGEPYAPNLVPRGDYTRVLAEFWADGPDSETPPGHWFRIYNEKVGPHPALERRVGGAGEPLDPLAFDVLAYLALGGAMHDAAIAAWSAKGAYDYPRPVSAIRYLAGLEGPGEGLPLVPGRIERVGPSDPLAGDGGEHVGKVKLLAWRGPDAITFPVLDTAGVGWILAETWWPYQRPSFVTPPFAGYVSGHSTFSRAAAEVLERLTGDPFFPGGLAEFVAPADEFLVFERGPSVDVTLQWATYRDAADQTSLSRIWGGIHPPADDLPGRRMGAEVGERAWARARALFEGAPDPNPARASAVPGTAPPAAAASGCASTGERRAGLGPAWLAALPWGAVRRRRPHVRGWGR